MKATFNSTGLSVKMYEEDINKSELECIIVGYKNPKLFVKFLDCIENSGNFEEPGFHIEAKPSNGGFDICDEVYIFIDKKRHHQIFEEYDSEFQGGFFLTRSPYDRIDITYWNPNIHPQIARNYIFK